MPRAAIAAGAADTVLDPEHIGEQVVALAKRLGKGHPSLPATADVVENAGFDAILRTVRAAKGLDLTHYRQTTLHRRVSRRMLLGGFDTMEQYAKILRESDAEIEALYRDILVNVTEFFREPEALAALTREAFPSVLERKGPEATFRLWVPGCSKGQEAYSIVMSLVEFLDTKSLRADIQMFASDVNDLDIGFARAGIYPDTISREVSPERLARFFTQVPGGYRVEPAIREMCVFAVHDITRDPPFSKLDIVSFRNVLIYMERPLQKHVLQVLHYSLEPGGFLLLGSSETTGGASGLFSVADKKHRLYVRKPGPARLLPSQRLSSSRSIVEEQPLGIAPAFDVLREAEKVVLDSYAPSGLLVNEALEVLQIRGQVSQFLDPAEGPPELTLSKLVAPGVASSARAAIREAARTGLSARRTGLLGPRQGKRTHVAIEAVPIPSPSGERYYLILLEAAPAQAPQPDAAPATHEKPGSEGSAQAAALRRELDETREYVESIIAEKEAVNRDLRVAGDKLQVTNEELRTINEEFQTAQEELQSTNEELTTLNDELRNRNTELGQLTDDLENVIQGVEIPILILGADLTIHRFTPQAERVINIVPTDVGRLVTDFTLKVDVPDFRGAVEQVLKTMVPSETEVRGADGHWYLMRIRPYKTGAGSVDGAVLAFVDIDLLKRTMQRAESAREHAEALVATVREPLLTLGSTLRVKEANQAFYDTFGVSAEETIDAYLYELGNGQWDIPELRDLLEQILPGDKEFADLEVEHDFPGIGRRIMILGARRVREEGGLPSILLAIDDVTTYRRQARTDAALNEISLMIGSTFDLEDIFDQVLEQSAVAVSADSGAILLRQEGAWVVKSVFRMSQPVVGQRLEDNEVPLSLFSAACGDPVLVRDVLQSERFGGSIGKRLGHRCVLMVPLILRQETFGSISFHHLTPDAYFTDADVDFGKRLGTLLSLAFENAQLYSAQRQIADTLQTALLTPPREIPGLEFGYLYRSATAAASVGGDLYDLFELSEHCVGVLIGDVSGKGVEAATLAGLVKNTIRALTYENESPADVIAKANDIVFKATDSSIFVTLMLGILDTRTGKFVYCSAGHTRGIVKKRGGDVELLETQSPLTGAFSVVDFVNGETSIGKGDALVLYTDGVTESRRDGELLGENGLVALVEAFGTVPTGEIPAAIFEDVLDYSGGELADDIAIISVSLA